MDDADDLLAELVEEETRARRDQATRVNLAAEEYILARYKHHLHPEIFAPSLLSICQKYRVPRGKLEYKINSMRRRLEQEVEDGVIDANEAHSIGEWLGYLLNGAAKAQKEKRDAAERRSDGASD